MKPVPQEEISGCGIACVAVLAGVNYDRARETAASLGIYSQDKALWFDTRYMRRMLAAYGMRAGTGEVPFTAWDALPDLCLLSIKWKVIRGRAFWHWVVFHRGPDGPVVLDPKKSLKTNVRRDFGRMKPKWHIEVRADGNG